MLRYYLNWKSIPVWEIPTNFSPQTKVTILIPARNESANIQACIQSILDQKYPSQLFEILVIDDHSEDDTAALVQQFQVSNVQVLFLKDFVKNRSKLQSFKKKAIEIGIEKSNGELIVSTDADCIVPPSWLNYLVSFYEKENYKFIAAPVNFHEENSLFEKFQSLDFLGMMGVTGAGIHGRFMNMCNGANLAYEKKAFYAVDGFNGIDKIASGDDMLLLQKMAKHFPTQIGFLKNKNATVLTKGTPDLKSFAHQRIRWASKSGNYQELQILFILALVFFFCVSIVFNFCLLPFFWEKIGWVFLTQLTIKTVVDFFYLNHLATFFQRKDLMKIFFPAQIFHIIYIFVIGLLGNVVKEYTWKGRKVK
jgi:cellulose synthase/poly-beta-1,6-N-acetylglucosamine synthase-like glycosyltransferase